MEVHSQTPMSSSFRVSNLGGTNGAQNVTRHPDQSSLFFLTTFFPFFDRFHPTLPGDRVQLDNRSILFHSISTVTLSHLLQDSTKVIKVAVHVSQKSRPQLMSERHCRRLLVRGNDDRTDIP